MCVLALSALFIVFGMQVGEARAQSSASQGEEAAKRALDPAAVTAFDGSLTWVDRQAIAQPVNGSSHEITYTMTGPGAGAKSNVEFRVYDNAADAAAHADPDMSQQKDEAEAYDSPRGRFKTYHSKLSGSALAQDVPETFHCRALAKGEWSRCYYYPGGESNIVVVGTTTSKTANEAILITAMGAQGLATEK
jgi:hypothetical protein